MKAVVRRSSPYARLHREAYGQRGGFSAARPNTARPTKAVVVHGGALTVLTRNDRGIAQMEEQRTFNPEAEGSTPSPPASLSVSDLFRRLSDRDLDLSEMFTEAEREAVIMGLAKSGEDFTVEDVVKFFQHVSEMAIHVCCFSMVFEGLVTWRWDGDLPVFRAHKEEAAVEEAQGKYCLRCKVEHSVSLFKNPLDLACGKCMDEINEGFKTARQRGEHSITMSALRMKVNQDARR